MKVLRPGARRKVIVLFLIVALVGLALSLATAKGSTVQLDAYSGAAYVIRDDSTGGDCTRIGTWDSAGKTCTLYQDVSITITSDPGSYDGPAAISIQSDGITLDGASHTLASTNGSSVASYGVTSFNSGGGVTIRNLTLSGFGAGISTYGDGNMISGVYISACGTAINISDGNGSTILGNTITPGASTDNGIMVAGSSANTIYGNTINASGIQTYFQTYGINLIAGANANIVDSNSINSLGNGILVGGWENRISSNSIVGSSSIGIDLTGGNNTVRNNTMSGGDLGFNFRGSDNTVMDNSVSGATIGMSFSGASNNGIIGNTITGSSASTGIAINGYISPTTDNIFKGNTVSDCLTGLSLYTSSSNSFYHNNFINNATQASTNNGISNAFNQPKPDGGNYWSNWTSPDNDLDGFVDAPFVINGDNCGGGCGVQQDNLPRATPDNWMAADKTAPAVTYTGPNGLIKSTSPTITATYSDPDVSSGIDTGSAQAYITGTSMGPPGGNPTPTPCTVTPGSGNTGTISCNASGLFEGEYSVILLLKDSTPNIGIATGGFDVDLGLHIRDDASGGDCASIGSWNAANKKCTLNQDLAITSDTGIVFDNDGLSLDGTGHEMTSASNLRSGIRLQKRSGVTVSNLRLTGFGSGVALNDQDCNNNTFSGITVANGFDGFYIQGSGNTLTNNAVSHTTGNWGIAVSGTGTTLTGNTLTGNHMGIDFRGGANATTMSGNTMTGNETNVALAGGSDTDNIDITNLVDGKPVYYKTNLSNQTFDAATNAGVFYCRNCVNVTVKDLVVGRNSEGVYFSGAANSRVENITAANITGTGITVKGDGNTLTGNNASSSSWGMEIMGDNNTVSGNNSSTNRYLGISVSGSGNVIENNTASGNISRNCYTDPWGGQTCFDPSGSGITLTGGGGMGGSLATTNNQIRNNTASGNYAGIVLSYGASSNTVTGNAAADNYIGLNISGTGSHSSDRNTLTQNTISENKVAGLRIDYSAQNLIYWNNFLYNTEQVIINQGTGNDFNGTIVQGGNYWSDFHSTLDGCVDANSDKRCDYPYMVHGYVIDLWPWDSQDGWKVTLDPIGNKSVDENTELHFSLTASQPGGGDYTYFGTSLPIGAVLSPDGVFSWTPTYSQAGTYPGIVITVADGNGDTDSETITINVNNINRAPVLGAVGNINDAKTGTLTHFNTAATDPDGDAVTYSAANLPAGANLSAAGDFTWTPGDGQTGTFSGIVITATDSGGLTDSETISIKVGIGVGSHVNAKWTSLHADSNNPGEPVESEKEITRTPGGQVVGYVQKFVKGRLYYNQTMDKTFWVHGGIMVMYDRLGSHSGPYGLPISDELDTSGITGGRESDFEEGKLFWSITTGTHGLQGTFLQRFENVPSLATGGPAANGLPISDAYPVWGGYAQNLQGAYVTWRSDLGDGVGRLVRGGVFAKYQMLGGPGGVLHLIKEEEHSITVVDAPGAVQADFENGYVFWSSVTGSHPVNGGIYAKYSTQYGGPTGHLGLPKTDEYDIPLPGGGRRQAFQHGFITWGAWYGTWADFT